jgi:prefoldin alpha subunit
MADGHEILQKAMILREESEESEKQLEFVQQQITELDEFSKTLEELEKNTEKEMLAPIGKGVYAKAIRKDEKLFVEVGAGVMVRKTPDEARKIIEEQIKKFTQTRVQLTAQLEKFREEFGKMLKSVEKFKKDKQ